MSFEADTWFLRLDMNSKRLFLSPFPPPPQSTTMTLLEDIMKRFSFLFPPPPRGKWKKWYYLKPSWNNFLFPSPSPSPSPSLPPLQWAICWAALTINWFSPILLGGERHSNNNKCIVPIGGTPSSCWRSLAGNDYNLPLGLNMRSLMRYL